MSGSEDQALLQQIAQLAGAINKHKNQQNGADRGAYRGGNQRGSRGGYQGYRGSGGQFRGRGQYRGGYSARGSGSRGRGSYGNPRGAYPSRASRASSSYRGGYQSPYGGGPSLRGRGAAFVALQPATTHMDGRYTKENDNEKPGIAPSAVQTVSASSNDNDGFASLLSAIDGSDTEPKGPSSEPDDDSPETEEAEDSSKVDKDGSDRESFEREFNSAVPLENENEDDDNFIPL